MSFQRHFSMSAIGAVVAIRRYLAAYPEANAQDAATSIQRSDADYTSYDFLSALELHELLPTALGFRDYHADLRECLALLLLKHRPWWIQAIPFGRARVASTIGQGEIEGRNELQMLRAASLYEEPISVEARLWWDQLSQIIRRDLADDLLAQGRLGEELSMAYELRRLKGLGIEREPRWIAIEDNGAGYDIQSYDRGSTGPLNRLIEVKTSKRQATPRIILTKGEWETALRYGASYVFHIWKLPSQTLIEKTVEEIALHIPMNQGNGSWLQVEIDIEA